MTTNEISLLKGQIAKLSDKKFDLEAWKNSTLIFLERIFGRDDLKLKMIGELKYDYSSWNMRNTAASGKASNLDPVLMQAEEILQAAITELETLGQPSNDKKQKLLDILKEEMTGKDYQELESYLSSLEIQDFEKIHLQIKSLGEERLTSIITKLLTS